MASISRLFPALLMSAHAWPEKDFHKTFNERKHNRKCGHAASEYLTLVFACCVSSVVPHCDPRHWKHSGKIPTPLRHPCHRAMRQP
jgi:hypothetical protein